MAREKLRSVDAAWLQMDRPVNTADVVAVLTLEGTLSVARLRALVERRLLAHRRFRQHIVRGELGGPEWEDDPRFSLDAHLVHRELSGAPGELEDYVSAVASLPLDLGRPPWRIHLLHTRGASTIVAKLHHCVADGFALVAVLLSMTDEPPVRGGTTRPRTLPAAARGALRGAGTLGSAAVLAASLGRMIALPADPATPLKRALSGDRRVAWSRPFPLPHVRTAARERGNTVNELLCAALAGALRRWLAEAGEPTPSRDVRALVPVNLRPLGEEARLGNEFGLVFLDLPVSAPRPEERVREMHARMQALKAGPDALVTYGVLAVLGGLPTPVEHAINAFFTSKASLVVTSVPGPRRALHLAGHRIEHLMFWVPHPASLGVGVSILTYAGEVVVGVRADAAIMPEPAQLVRLFEAELRALAPPRPRGARAGPRAQAPSPTLAARELLHAPHPPP